MGVEIVGDSLGSVVEACCRLDTQTLSLVPILNNNKYIWFSGNLVNKHLVTRKQDTASAFPGAMELQPFFYRTV